MLSLCQIPCEIASEEAKAIIQAVCDGDPEIHEGNEMGYNAAPRKNTNKKKYMLHRIWMTQLFIGIK